MYHAKQGKRKQCKNAKEKKKGEIGERGKWGNGMLNNQTLKIVTKGMGKLFQNIKGVESSKEEVA